MVTSDKGLACGEAVAPTATVSPRFFVRVYTRKEGPLGEDERARLRRLEDENRVLRMERDFLKKAAAFFAKETK